MHLNEDKGKLIAGGFGLMLNKVLPATLLEDLFIRGRISLEPHRKKVYIEVVDEEPTGISSIDEVLAHIIKRKNDGKKKREAADWITFLAKKMKKLEDELWVDLQDQGQIEIKKGKIILKNDIKSKLKEEIKAVVTKEREPDNQMTALLGFFRRVQILLIRSRFHNKIV